LPTSVNDGTPVSWAKSQQMARVAGADTAPELRVRRYLFAHGYRYRLHVRALPGRPDIVLRKWDTAILINGCFWHGHDCARFAWPGTRSQFWRQKISGNIERDERNRNALLSAGWRVCTLWTCGFGRTSESFDAMMAVFLDWLTTASRELQYPSSEVVARE
jgi:DNA mismatch endonuclease, patch repair protein